MIDTLWAWTQRLLPKRLLSRFVYRLARCERPWVRRPLIRGFARIYRINLAEAESDDLDAYPTFNAFFTRALRPSTRPLSGDAATLVAPVDGRVAEHGVADDGQLLQAKGLRYSLPELLGEDPATAQSFAGCAYATFYLAPHDYHRVHMPLDGTLTSTRYIPGSRFSVDERTARTIRGLYCRNERAVCRFETSAGPMAVVLVGALNVSSITTAWLGEIASGAGRCWQAGHPPPRFARGEEIGRFNLGSTVVVLLPPGSRLEDERLRPGSPVRLGERIGTRAPG